MAIKSKVKKSKFSVNKERTSNKAVICARVSTTDQEDNHSLVAQRNRLIEYCKRNRFEIIKEFEIVESSTKGDRPKFQEMLQFIEEQKEPINLVSDKVDRLQRSIMDIGKIDDLVKYHNMALHFLDIGRLDNDSNASQKAFYRIAVVFANAYTDAISDNVKRSIGKKLKEGTILGPATLGYINKERPNKKLEPNAIVLLDPVRAPLVKRMFEDYATGAYSIKQVMQNATKAGLRTLKGHKLSHSTVEGILKQPFYYGFIQSGGELYKHRYEPLITKELFDICQDIRAGKTTDKTRIPKTEEDFTYRGLIRCHHCKCVYTPDPKKGGRYIYMKPTKSQGDCEFCKNTNENVINEQIEHIIKELTITKEALEAIKPELKKVLEENKSLNEIKFDELNKKLKNIEKRQEELIESLTEEQNDQSITLDEIQKMNTVLSMKKTQIQDELLSLDINNTSTRNQILTIFELAEGMYDIFESSNNIKKRELIKILFSNLELSGLNLHYSLQKPFDLLQKKEGQPVWLPNMPLFLTESHQEIQNFHKIYSSKLSA
ncbi:recombinase family protein [Candidatus Deianiraea vastatrix]|uniref:Cassette chromosome recombinase B-like protein n=1 Tax=Candidatus Deianiraea vastatrix TaxID=2163644 RepID=A0A5B8XCH9_9RICK|nr:recombinase family protein [Candidatus Deianiraea vastatrix]QED23042.1 Putative cassette chromosome recombinase B-like protein [Candidatus Deianiraea vastatrix]